MITIKLFANLKDKAGKSELHIAAQQLTLSDLIERIAREHPALSEMLSCGRIIVSINQELAGRDALIKDGDEVALMPPFSGGGPSAGVVRIQKEPFSIEEETTRLKTSSASIGAIVAFLGTTRDISRNKKVSQLEFEHYPGMAEKMLLELRERAIRDYRILDATIIHRTGIIPAGDDIVLVLVAAGHRDEAFAACRFCIDELKRTAPIWKKETTPEGEVWVEEHP